MLELERQKEEYLQKGKVENKYTPEYLDELMT